MISFIQFSLIVLIVPSGRTSGCVQLWTVWTSCLISPWWSWAGSCLDVSLRTLRAVSRLLVEVEVQRTEERRRTTVSYRSDPQTALVILGFVITCRPHQVAPVRSLVSQWVAWTNGSCCCTEPWADTTATRTGLHWCLRTWVTSTRPSPSCWVRTRGWTHAVDVQVSVPGSVEAKLQSNFKFDIRSECTDPASVSSTTVLHLITRCTPASHFLLQLMPSLTRLWRHCSCAWSCCPLAAETSYADC